MTLVVRVAGLCLTAVLLCKVLERYAREQAILLTLAACGGGMIAVVLLLSPVLTQITSLFAVAGLDESYAEIVFKAIGICYITQLTCDVCRDCKESALCTVASLAGKGSLLFLALPMLKTLLHTVEGVLQ